MVSGLTPSRQTLEVLDPSTEEPCATISLGTEADVDRAVAAAKAAFETFSQTSVEERAMLERMAEILRRIGEIAEAIRLEMGAPIKLASTAQPMRVSATLPRPLKSCSPMRSARIWGHTGWSRSPSGSAG